MEEINKEYLISILEYVDGCLFWKNDQGNVKAGSRAGGVGLDSHGYRRVGIKSKIYLEHRLIYVMHHGEYPKEIDHIDGNKTNNKIENLRSVTRSQNRKNTGLRADNTSGVKNVSWYAPTNRWRVRVATNNLCKTIGYFKDLELAELVALEARDKFHESFANHGVTQCART